MCFDAPKKVTPVGKLISVEELIIFPVARDSHNKDKDCRNTS